MDKLCKILMIEDDESARVLIRKYIEYSRLEFPGYSYNIDEAVTLNDGVAKLAAGHYDAILLDLGLPGVTGLESLRSVIVSTETPIIVLTGSDSEQKANDSIAIGAVDYLVKDKIIEVRTLLRSILLAIERDARKQHDKSLLQSIDTAVASLAKTSNLIRDGVQDSQGKLREIHDFLTGGKSKE